jgi:hypothetical protein
LIQVEDYGGNLRGISREVLKDGWTLENKGIMIQRKRK